jgi:hypothetical protein
MRQIVRCRIPFGTVNILRSEQNESYPIPRNMLPQDVESILRTLAERDSNCAGTLEAE